MKWVWRILGGLAALIIAAVACLWLLGFRSKTGRNSVTVEIDRPAAQVWRYLENDDLVLKWVSGLSEIRHLNPDVNGAGARFVLSEVVGERRTDMEMEITAFEVPRHIGFRIKSPEGVSPGFTETGEYVLVEKDGRTTLTLSGDSRYFPFWIQLMEPVITPAAQKKLRADLARLKALVEAEPVSASH